jgi:hypothetical protein
MRVKGACSMFLDSFLYNAHGTAADALWCRVPVLTKAGEIQPARVAASLILHPARPLPLLVARSPSDMVAIAVSFAQHASSSSTRPMEAGLGVGAIAADIANGVAGQGETGIFDVVSWTREWERALSMAAHAAFLELSPAASSSASSSSSIGHVIVSHRQ